MTFPDIRTFSPAKAGLALLALLAAAGLVFYFLSAPQRAREANAKADATEIIADSAQGAARDTIHHYDRYVERIVDIDQRTEETNRDILGTVGAEARINTELHAAGVRALCLHDNRHDAVCELVLHGYDGSSEPEGPDATRPGSR